MNKNPFWTKLLNTFVNPFEPENVLGDTAGEKALYHGAGLLTTSAALAFAANALAHRKRELDKVRDTESLKAYINAKYPILSPDKSTRDLKEEEKEQLTGVEKALEKESEFRNPLEILREGLSRAGRFVGSASSDPRHAAIAAASVLAGLGGGIFLSNRLEGRRSADKTARQIEEARNRYQKLIHDEMKRLEKESAAKDYLGQYKGEDAQSTSMGAAFNSLAWLYALGTMALAYGSAKEYFDDKDPARLRQKRILDRMKEMELVKDPPLVMGAGLLPEKGEDEEQSSGKTTTASRPAIPKSLRKIKPVSVEQKQLPEGSGKQDALESAGIPTDPTDPFATLLQRA